MCLFLPPLLLLVVQDLLLLLLLLLLVVMAVVIAVVMAVVLMTAILGKMAVLDSRGQVLDSIASTLTSCACVKLFLAVSSLACHCKVLARVQ